MRFPESDQSAFPLFRSVMRMEGHRIAHYETDIFDDFEGKTMITALDRDCIQHPMKEEIVVVPNGVDFAKFSHDAVPKTHDLIFSGNMNYPPNVDAAVYLVKEILPELRKKHPEVRLMLAGADPSKKVRALQNDHVTVTGWVPSMTACYAQARIFIAPEIAVRHLAVGRQAAGPRRQGRGRHRLQHHPPIRGHARPSAHGFRLLPGICDTRTRFRI